MMNHCVCNSLQDNGTGIHQPGLKACDAVADARGCVSK
jgi:hypothetical protein